MIFFNIYRWVLLGVTCYNVINLMLWAFEYKQYYDRIPLKVRQYLQRKTVRILGDKILENKQELWINLGLLLLLMVLNAILFFI